MLENSLPEWIIQRAQVDSFTEYPNAKVGFAETVSLFYFIGFSVICRTCFVMCGPHPGYSPKKRMS